MGGGGGTDRSFEEQSEEKTEWRGWKKGEGKAGNWQEEVGGGEQLH